MIVDVVPEVVWSATSQLATETREDRLAVKFSFDALRDAVKARRYKLPGSRLDRLGSRWRLGQLQSDAADSSFYERNFVVVGGRDLGLLRTGAGLLLAREEAQRAHLEEVAPPCFDLDWHLYGSRFMPALRAINDALDPSTVPPDFVMIGGSTHSLPAPLQG